MTSSRENLLYLKSVEKKLSAKKIPSALAEAENLITGVAGIDRLEFLTGDWRLTGPQKSRIEKALKARLGGKPLAQLLKRSDFFGHSFLVTRDVLIPRPETEILVEEALKILDEFYPSKITPPNLPLARGGNGSEFSYETSENDGPEILDIGTGSGAIALCLTLKRHDCKMTALDASSRALGVARANAKRFGLQKKVRFVKSDLFGAFAGGKKRAWNLIAANPPYIPTEELPKLSREVRSEPCLALDGGHRGLEVIEKILSQAPDFLKKNGWLVMEIGRGQSAPISKKYSSGGGFSKVRFVKDYAGIDRILIAMKN